MPGPISRPAKMRDMLYNNNWRIGYKCIPITAVILVGGAFWVNYKRNRYDRFFEKMRDPEYINMLKENAAITPEKYHALLERLQDEMVEVRRKHGFEE